MDASGLVGSMDPFNQQALNVLTSSKLLSALDLTKETVKTRERYGKGASLEHLWRLLKPIAL